MPTANSRRTTPKKTVTSASDWVKEALEERKGKPLTVPSGKTCLVAKPDGLKAFTDKGMVPNALMPIMQRAMSGAKLDEGEIEKTITENPSVIADMIDMVDAVVIDCVVEPKVSPIPLDEGGEVIPPHERDDDDTLYVDYIDYGDKMAIFNYALNGVQSVAKFR
jgi:hypothetical protein